LIRVPVEGTGDDPEACRSDLPSVRDLVGLQDLWLCGLVVALAAQAGPVGEPLARIMVSRHRYGPPVPRTAPAWENRRKAHQLKSSESSPENPSVS
jgi:hypothetical protein